MVPSFIQIMAACIPLRRFMYAAPSWAWPNPWERLEPALMVHWQSLLIPRRNEKSSAITKSLHIRCNAGMRSFAGASETAPDAGIHGADRYHSSTWNHD